MAPKKVVVSKKAVLKKEPAKKSIVKTVKAESKKPAEKPVIALAKHVRVQTAEGWKRSMKKQRLL